MNDEKTVEKFPMTYIFRVTETYDDQNCGQ